MAAVKSRASLAAILLALAAAPAGAWGQPSGSMIIDQNRADRQPPTAPPRKAPRPAGTVSPAAPIDIKPFTLTGVRLDGASIPAALANQAFRPFIGQRMDAAALGRLTQAASNAYAHSDIALYTIVLPNQTFEGGVVRLRAIEGYIAHVTVKDAGGGAGKDVGLARRYLTPVLNERPLRTSTAQRSILLIRDIPGVTADVQFLKGGASGAVDLMVALKRKPFQIGVGFNDQGTSELGRDQLEVDLTANSLFRPGDQTRLTIAAPTDVQRFQYYALSHSEVLTDSGVTATASIGYLHTLPQSIPLQGVAETAGLSLSDPLIRSNKQNLTLTGSIDGVNSDNALFGQEISNDHTRAARVAAAYNRAHGRTTVAVSVTASFGLDALGAQVTNPLLSDKTFKKLNGRVGLDYQLSKRWVVRLRGTGQLSADRLPAVEQLPLGGQDFGRAFEAASIVGDQGLAGSVEVAYVPTGLPHLIRGSELYGFTDRGEVWNTYRVILPASTYELASAGLGARIAVASKSVLQLEAAKALQDPYPGEGDAWRVTFSVRSLY
jgi:hemolysin activation/secretion protein